jgi:hypothetical protein
MFGDDEGWVYTFDEDVYSDNLYNYDPIPIDCLLEGFIHASKPEANKIWKKVTAFANPGCQATLMLAASDTFINPYDVENNTQSNMQVLDYRAVGSLTNGILEYRGDLRGNFLYYKVIESSTGTPFTFYGFNIEYDFIGD